MSSLSSLFSPGNVLFIKDFEFEDGTVHDKLMIVLHRSADTLYVIHSLTTSQIKVPENKIMHGCTNNASMNLSFYMFAEKRVVGKFFEDDTKDFSFDDNTFLLFQQNIRKNAISSFKPYKDSNTIHVLAVLERSELLRLLKCAISSPHLVRGYKPDLVAFRDSIK
jgi:hypothetical protein